jgi:flagellar basal-body rod modification protein FlgD
MDIAAAASYNTGFANDATGAIQERTLNQDDFLRLLITQLSAQDPLNPVSNADFLAQMAQFTSLEQTRSMSAEMARIGAQQQLLQANSLLGQNVEIAVGPDATLLGTVSAVQIQDGAPRIVVEGTAYDLSQVLTITPQPPNP